MTILKLVRTGRKGMLPLERILCPTDFSESSYEALEVAVELARHFSSELLLVHVVTSPPMVVTTETASTFQFVGAQRAAEERAIVQLEELAQKRVPEDVCSRNMVLFGNAPDRIVALAQDERADMIVIASHGHSVWRRFFFGSTVDKVLRLSPCPVLTIYPSRPERSAAH